MINQYIINGGKPFFGSVNISGAKNAALPILAAAVMSDETVTLENLPDVSDVHVMLEAISKLGAYVKRVDAHTVKINGSCICRYSVDYNSIKKIRASYYMLGALIGKYKQAEVSLPGGCDIGTRPIDQHLKGFSALGCDVDICGGDVVADAKKLSGTNIFMDIISVGATINIMLAATLADGETVIDNAAKEPHVVDTANMLNSMGACIRGAGTDIIRIRGVRRLHGCTYSIVPDMIEAGTFMLASPATLGDVTVKNIIPRHMDAVSAKLREIGCKVIESDDSIRVITQKRPGKTSISTLPYPGFPTDLQPQFTSVLGLGNGTSTVTENVFDNRFRYTDELSRMGAHIFVEGGYSAIVNGIEQYQPSRVSCPDLRAGAALVLAALNANGTTRIDNIEYVLRGYEQFDKKLRELGADIRIANSSIDITDIRLNVG